MEINKVNNKAYSIEIIRYKIPMDQQSDFINAYSKASDLLNQSKYCVGCEVIHGVDETENFIVRIHWTSIEEHLSGFRKSDEFKSFFELVKPFFNNIQEMKHYEKTKILWK